MTLNAGRSSGRLLLLTFVVLSSIPATTFAQSAKPAKKDTPAALKPKDVKFTTSVAPIEAKPGESVVFKVTAKLNPGWHIYTYAKEQQGEGPRNTKFDFFDPAGLEVDGTWTASKEPIRKKEPAFPTIDSVSFFEDEVTWSLTLKVPANAAPGVKDLRCQASYQICDAKSCSFPGLWTLPDAQLTILPTNADQAKSAPKPDAKVAEVAKPKLPDSPIELKPPGVVLTPSVAPIQAKAGETVAYQITAKLQPG
jgi:DsbC/DsbD-like thiol-disulfide interchange protein